MRLLKVASLLDSSYLELEDFTGAHTPSYAILSHTWGRDEVLYGDVVSGMAYTKAGLRKIYFTASEARSHKLDYVWIDTCCIDKSSSAELQEAVNSMYSWYRRAEVCYVYLEDVDILADVDYAVFCEQLCASRWFSRGWTLQELLAPQRVQFFTLSWECVWPSLTTGGSDDRHILVAEIARASGISKEVIAARPAAIHEQSIATRMSWAAKRVTTREEDIAYSLLGIFDVNMPLLYGEGRKAFRRLQQAILDQSDDSSIFCWTSCPDKAVAGGMQLSGLLADEPSCFGSVAPAVMDGLPQYRAQALPYAMTNKGLQITLPLSQISDDIYLALLDCRLLGLHDIGQRAAIYVIRLLSSTNQFARLLPDVVVPVVAVNEFTAWKVETIFVRQGSGSRVHYLAEEHLPSFYRQYSELMEVIHNG